MNAKHCEICTKEIPRGNMSYSNKKYQAKKYCSRECHSESMKKEYKYSCADCGNEVIRTKEGITTNVFCNDVCKGRYAGKKNKGRKITKKNNMKKICINCTETYSVIGSRENSKFCSINCRAEYNAKIITKSQENRATVKCNSCKSDITRRLSSINDLNFCNSECMSEYYSKESLFSGENSGTWNGGKKTYYGENWHSQRRKTRERDNHTCQRCGVTEEEYGQELSVHHIVPFIMFDNYLEANEDDNLVSVCEPCHRKIHSGDNHPSKFNETYKNLVDDIV